MTIYFVIILNSVLSLLKMNIYKKNKALASKAASVWNSKNFDLLNEVYHIDCILHQQNLNNDMLIQGIKKFEEYMGNFLIKYPDYKEKIIYQIAEDNKVVNIIECFSKNISWSGVVIDNIKNDKIIETWAWFKRT